MTLAKEIYTGNGSQTVFSYGGFANDLIIGVDVSAQVFVYVDGVKQTTVSGDFNTSTSEVTISPAPADGSSVVVQRETLITSQYVTYTDNSIIDDSVLNQDSDQMFYLIQEQSDRIDDAMIKEPGGTYFEGEGLEVRNATAGTTTNSLVTVGQMQAAVAGVSITTLDNASTWRFDGDASTTAFSLTSAPAGLSSGEQLLVSISGVQQRWSTDESGSALDYYLDTTTTPPTLNFTSAPPTGVQNIYVFVVTGDVVVTTVADGSITSGKLANDSVTLAKLGFDAGDNNRFIVVSSAGNPALRTINHTDIADFDTGVRQNRISELLDATSAFGMGGNQINNLGAGSLSTDAVNKGQLDSAIAGVPSNAEIAIGAGTVTASSYATASPGFQPDGVLITGVYSGSVSTHFYALSSTSPMTFGDWTVTRTSTGFSLSVSDAGSDGQTIHWIAVRSI